MKILLLAGAAFAALFAFIPASQAQESVEAKLGRLHSNCNGGDRGACVRFGMLLEVERIRDTQWRRTHPEFYWWEH